MKTQTTTFGIRNLMCEPTNYEASTYITENYEELLKYATKLLGDSQSAGDLLNDVYMSILTDENNGEGVNPDGSRFKENYTAAQWVKSRMTLYSKNKCYHSNGKQEINVGMLGDSEAEDDAAMTAVQQAYFNAAHYDDLEMLELEASVQDDMKYLLGFENDLGVNFRGLFQIILDGSIEAVDMGILASIKSMGEDVLEALQNVLTFGAENKSRFDNMLEAVLA